MQGAYSDFILFYVFNMHDRSVKVFKSWESLILRVQIANGYPGNQTLELQKDYLLFNLLWVQIRAAS